MPVHDSVDVRGRLFVKIDIDMPGKLDLDEKELAMLKKLLSKMDRDNASRQPKSKSRLGISISCHEFFFFIPTVLLSTFYFSQVGTRFSTCSRPLPLPQPRSVRLGLRREGEEELLWMKMGTFSMIFSMEPPEIHSFSF